MNEWINGTILRILFSTKDGTSIGKHRRTGIKEAMWELYQAKERPVGKPSGWGRCWKHSKFKCCQMQMQILSHPTVQKVLHGPHASPCFILTVTETWKCKEGNAKCNIEIRNSWQLTGVQQEWEEATHQDHVLVPHTAVPRLLQWSRPSEYHSAGLLTFHRCPLWSHIPVQCPAGPATGCRSVLQSPDYVNKN